MELLFIKAVSVIGMVLGLSYIAERVSPKISGVLSGLPVGSSITLLFFAIEQGTSYTEVTSLYNIQGLFPALIFSIVYYMCTFYYGRFQILLAIVASTLSYVLTALLLANLTPSLIWTPIIMIILLDIAAIYFAKKENFTIANRKKVKPIDLVYRASLTACIFLIITSLPNFLPSNVAGIFSSFPSILLPLLIIMNIRYGNLQARTIVKNTPKGLSSIVIYSLVVHFSYSSLGIALGTFLALSAAIIYMYFQIKLFKFFKWD